MNGYLLYMCSILISNIVLIEWYDLFFDRKTSYKKILLSIFVYLCGVLGFVFLSKHILQLNSNYINFLGGILEVLFDWLIFIRQYKGSLIKKLAVYISFILILPGFEVYAFKILDSYIFSTSRTNTYITEVNNFTVQIVTYIFILIIGGIKRRKKYKDSSFYIIPFIFMLIFQLVWHYFFEDILLERFASKNADTYLLSYGFSVVIFFCICIVYKKNIRDVEHRRMEKERLDFYKLQYGHYHDTRDHLNELKGIKHDFRKHMIVLKSLSQENRQEELDQYIDDMESQISLSTEIVDAKNSVISAQLTHAKELCRKNEIFFDYILEYEQINIAPFDLNTVVGNMLDNAVEASMQIKEKNSRRIQIIIQSQKGMVMIVCKNNFQGEIRKNNNYILTSKKDSKKHGLGIQNIRDTVKKYEGKIDITTENQTFYIAALLRNVNGNITEYPE